MFETLLCTNPIRRSKKQQRPIWPTACWVDSCFCRTTTPQRIIPLALLNHGNESAQLKHSASPKLNAPIIPAATIEPALAALPTTFSAPIFDYRQGTVSDLSFSSSFTDRPITFMFFSS